MNKKSQKKLSRQKRIWEYSLAKRKRTEREIAKLEREVEKIQNSTPQIIRVSNEQELAREEMSRKPKEKIVIENIRAYRKQRAKNRKK